MPFWREYYIILFDDDHIFVIFKEYVKARIPTDKEEEARKYYQEVKR